MSDFSAEAFFASHPPPVDLDSTLDQLEKFIQFHAQHGRKVVLVTVSLSE